MVSSLANLGQVLSIVLTCTGFVLFSVAESEPERLPFVWRIDSGLPVNHAVLNSHNFTPSIAIVRRQLSDPSDEIATTSV